MAASVELKDLLNGLPNLSVQRVVGVTASGGLATDLDFGDLGDGLAKEAQTRGQADTALGGRIDTEAQTRGQADTALGGRIDTEAATRLLNDLILEAVTRALGDARVADAPDDMVSGFRWAPTIGPGGAIPFGVLDNGSTVIYALQRMFFAADDEARFSTYALQFDYADGRVQLGLRRDGDVDAALRITPLILDRIDVARAARIHAQIVDDDTFSRVAVSAIADRVLAHANGVTRPYVKRTDIASSTYLLDTVSLITLLLHAGQSNSAGAGENVLVNAIAPRPQTALMLNIGAVTSTAAVSPAAITDFVPLLDTSRADGTSETPGPGMGSWLARMDEIERARGGAYVYCSHGIGGKLLSELAKGSISYANGITSAQRSIAIATQYGKQVKLTEISYTHGEGDAFAGTSQATYLSQFNQLIADYNTDLVPLLPAGNGPIRLLVDQVPASGIGLSGKAVALAQLQAARTNANVVMAGPRYWARLSRADDVHMTATSRALLGEYHAKVRRRLAQGVAWTGLRPLSVTRTGALIAIKFAVPVGPLRWEFDVLPPAANYGFGYSDSANSASIKSVSITAADTVTVELTAAPSGSNKAVNYALSPLVLGYGTRPGAWGNLCDSDTTPSFQVPGRVLTNFSVAFEESVP